MKSASSKIVLSCTMALIAGYAAIPTAAQSRGGETKSKPDSSYIRKQKLKTPSGVGLIKSGSRSKPGAGGEGGLAGAPIVNEGFEAFATGPVNGQFGWTTFAAAVNAPVVSTTSPIGGTKSVELPQGGVATGTLNGVFSPTSVQPAGDYTAIAKINIPNTGGAIYDIAFQAPSQSMITSRVSFYYDDADGDSVLGDVLVYDGAAGAPQITGFEYTPGTTHTLKVELDNTNSQQRYFLDGTLIWVGTIWAGNAVEQAVLFSDSFQLPGEIGRIDDVSFEPGVAPPPAPPTADVTDDCVVNVTDLLAVIAAWGATGANSADVNGDLVVNVTDLLAVIAQWNQTCPTVPNGACCNAGSCSSTSFIACETAGGTFQGGTVNCADVTCPQPTLNDHPAGAIDITANINGAAINDDNTGATPTAGNDADLPAGALDACIWTGDTTTAHNTMWYKFTAPASGTVTLGTCTTLSTGGLNDSIIGVFTGTPGSLAPWSCAEDTAGCGATTDYLSRVSPAGLTAGQVYYVVVGNPGGWGGSTPGPFVLTITDP